MLAIGTLWPILASSGPSSGYSASKRWNSTFAPSFLKWLSSNSCCLVIAADPLGRGPRSQSCFK